MKHLLIATNLLMIMGVAINPGKSSIKATATDLYAKRESNTGNCCRLVTMTNCPSSVWQTSSSGTQAKVTSNGGTVYNIFEDNACSRAVYFSGC